MIRLDRAVEIDASIDRVWDVISDVERYPTWLPGVRTASWLTDAGPAVGSEFRLELDGPGGRALPARGVVEVVEPPSRVAVRATASQARLAATIDLEPMDAPRTRARVLATIELTGLARFAEGMVRSSIERDGPAAMERLRADVTRAATGGAEPP